VPEFWDWLEFHGNSNNIKIPQEVYEEFSGGSDELATWAADASVESALLLAEDVVPSNVTIATTFGYAPDLNDVDLVKLGRDPFLIAYALADLGNRTVVTTEKSKPKQQRANRKIPDVCRTLAVPCIGTFELTTALNFATNWSSQRSA